MRRALYQPSMSRTDLELHYFSLSPVLETNCEEKLYIRSIFFESLINKIYFWEVPASLWNGTFANKIVVLSTDLLPPPSLISCQAPCSSPYSHHIGLPLVPQYILSLLPLGFCKLWSLSLNVLLLSHLFAFLLTKATIALNVFNVAFLREVLPDLQTKWESTLMAPHPSPLNHSSQL